MRDSSAPILVSSPKSTTLTRAAGWLSMICGTLGLLVSLVVVGGVWIVRGQVDAQIVAVADDVDRWVGHAEASLVRAGNHLDVVQGRLRQIGERGESLVRSGTVGQEAVNDLIGAIDRELGDEYRQFREAWAAVYTRVESIMDVFDRVQQTLPMLNVASPPRDEIEALNQRVGEIDDALHGLRAQAVSGAEQVTSALQTVVDGLQRIDAGLSALGQAVRSYQSRLLDARASIAAASSTILGWLLVAAITLTLVLAYAALAHAALIAYGWGQLRRLGQIAETAPIGQSLGQPT